jgi:hypothetical protein
VTCHGLASVHYCCDDNNNTDNRSNNNNNNKPRTAFPCLQTTCGACLAANMKAGRSPAWHGCGPAHTSVYTGMDVEAMEEDHNFNNYSNWFLPQHSALALLSSNSNSLWILTLRADATVWAESVLHWHSKTERLLRAFRYTVLWDDDSSNWVTVGLSTAVTAAQVEASLAQGLARANSLKGWQQRRRWLVEAYGKHLARVRRMAALYDQPLIEVVVDDPAAGRQLAEALVHHGVSLELSDADACWDWQAARVDDDWRDFSFPF